MSVPSTSRGSGSGRYASGLSRDKLQAYQITASDVAQALARENVELPGGRIESVSKEYSVKIKGEFPRVSDFNDLIVAYFKGAPVRIRDIGRAEDGLEERRSIARLNGETAVGLGIQKQSGTNTVEVVDLVKKELEKDPEDPAAGHEAQHLL